MKKWMRMICLALCLALLPAAALADRLYLMEDSNSRRLTEAELWEWDRESLSYMFNEIFARHGYVFQAGGQYDVWFRAMPWYTPNANPDNQTQVYPYISNLEWDNYNTIKKVISQMDAMNLPAHDPAKRCYTEIKPPISGIQLSSFSFVQLKGGQKLAVYSAPTTQAWRGANGKAAVDTNGAVWAAGWDNGWLLVFYETNNGAVRVGYVQGSAISGTVSNVTQLHFDLKAATVTAPCSMTDDPVLSNTTMRVLSTGTTVTYLSCMINQNGQLWDYVETQIDGKVARGFVMHGSLNIPQDVPADLSGYSI